MKLQRRERDSDSPDNAQGPGTTLIIAVVFVGILFSSLFIYITLRYLRRAHPTPPRFFPEKWKQKWTAWHLDGYNSTSSARTPSPSSSPLSASLAARNASARERRENRDRRRREQTAAAGVARGGSVRSVMTLPEYRAVPLPDHEVTIGREGERGGIDVVVEAPETADEEEQRREEHMQSLYEIRLARQLERAAERESAQNGGRGSVRSRGNSSVTSLAAALAAIQERERRLSEVSYAEVGLARPDGTRVRMSSETSDRDSLPLLDSGAPMGIGNSIRSGRSSHARTNSAISVGSMGLGSPERRRSDEIFRMGSARPSMDDRDSGSPDEGDRPPGYTGPDWGAPPEYSGAADDGGPRGGDIGIPAVRVDASSPDPFPPVYLRP